MNTSNRKPFFIILFFVVVIIAIIFLLCVMYERSIVSISSGASSSTSDQVMNDSANGYSLAVPHGWYVDNDVTSTLAVYPNYTPNAGTSPVCKIEMTSFDYSSSTNVTDWISARLGADPTVMVKERSSENISIGSDTDNTSQVTAIKWIGIMDDMPTIIVYAFNGDHAYEIVPSVIGETSVGSEQCDDDLDIFLQKLTF